MSDIPPYKLPSKFGEAYVDPWKDILTSEQLEEFTKDGNALCVNCVHPESNPKWFCHHCGEPTGNLTIWMHFLEMFWYGWLFRSGVDGSVKLTKFRIIGLTLFSLMYYGIFSPLYWYRLYRAAKGRYIQDTPKWFKEKKRQRVTIRRPYQYENYTDEELEKAMKFMDKDRFLERYQKLKIEIEKRRNNPPLR